MADTQNAQVLHLVTGGDTELDSSLLRQGKAGDHGALERLLARHERPLYALCYGILGHTDDAEDAVQESFLRALRSLARFREDSAFRTWLYRICLNVCLEWRRARRPAAGLYAEGLNDRDTRPSAEAAALRRLRLVEALATLQPRQRAILLLKEFEGWTVAEIAATLRWNEKKVENELFRARRRLADWRRREQAGDEQEGEGL